MEEKAIVLYRPAAEIIKTAILQGQYEAAKGVNRIQLAFFSSLASLCLRTLAREFGVLGHWRLSARYYEKNFLD